MLDLFVVVVLLIALAVVMLIQFNDIRSHLDQIENNLDDGYQNYRVSDANGKTYFTIRIKPEDYHRFLASSQVSEDLFDD